MEKQATKSTKKTIARHHSDWMRLVERSGPFLSMPVLMEVFPAGLDKDDREMRSDLRERYETWQSDGDDIALHRAWVRYVLQRTLEFPDKYLLDAGKIPAELKHRVAQHHETLEPNLVVAEPGESGAKAKSRLLISIVPPEQNLDKPLADRTWKASPATRMAELVRGCNNQGVRLGLVTNGEQWMLVHCKEGETAGFTTWWASIWFDEPITLRAFRALLSARRFFGDPDQTLERLFERSAQHQQELTDQLGLQVRDAIETLIEAIDRIDRERNRQLLKGFSEAGLYEAAVTLMMRLVFMFFAEERRLLPIKEAFYEQNYALSSLVDQLQAQKLVGEEVLDYRHAAWSRLLATFRAIHSGVQHDAMQLPAYSGSLFDPDRFPFLEGRPRESSWKDISSNPLPISDRTVLHIVEALQFLEVRGVGERVTRRLSFRELDVEQIGHIYESLLDHTAVRAQGHVIGLSGTKEKEPEVPLEKLETLSKSGRDSLVEYLVEETGKSQSALVNALDGEAAVDEIRLLAACENDEKLLRRLKPFANLIRLNRSGDPIVIPSGSVYVTEGVDRRTTGTHYTPINLTVPIVKYTLEPLVYIGPDKGLPEEKWKLRSARELLNLKICDMASGSGAFLVQACRYLSVLLVEAWSRADVEHPDVPGITPYGEPAKGRPDEQLIPNDSEERLVLARRLVAQRCLYGIDKNRLAVEMAKLSLWLLTLAKDKPFTFLDHCIRAGDSLVGISSIEQLLRFSLDERLSTGPLLEQQRKQIENRLNAVTLLRRQIEEQPSNTPQDIERKATMLKNADEQTRRLTYAADMLLAASWQPMTAGEREAVLNATLVEVEYRFKDLPVEELDAEAKKRLTKTGVMQSAHQSPSDCRFHWSLEFPEVFGEGAGFDAFVGNPPFMGGQKMKANLGVDYHEYLLREWDHCSGSADLCVFFFLRTHRLKGRSAGLIATNTISEGATREAGLEFLSNNNRTIVRATKLVRWPGAASVAASIVHLVSDAWAGEYVLEGKTVAKISPLLEEGTDGDPFTLAVNKSYIGSYLLGDFELPPKEAEELIQSDKRYADVIKPILNGKELGAFADLKPRRFVVDFGMMDERTARSYPKAWKIVEHQVFPYRMDPSRKHSSGSPWRYARPRPELYSEIKGLKRVLVVGITSKFFPFVFLPAQMVYDQALVVIPSDSYADYSILNSILHFEWSVLRGGKMRTDDRYNPSHCFDSFPFPTRSSRLIDCGKSVEQQRASIMDSMDLGLTPLYNRFHDPVKNAPAIRKLRDLHVEMDQAVAAAYGWDDLDLGHGFQTTKQGDRFTISNSARREVLQRLLKLNHERYAEEVKQGLHDEKGKAKRTDTVKRRKKSAATAPSLFGDDDDEGG